MVKTLKVFIFLLFLLSIGSLVLGSMLYGQREKLKTRILQHEASAVNISKKLRMEKPINPITLKDHLTLKNRLSPLAAEADNLNITLDDTRADLEETRTELAETKETLESTKTQLAAAPWAFIANWKQNAATSERVEGFALQPSFFLLLNGVAKN